MDNRPIVIFDGVCNFCNGAVNFIINRDPEGVFAFTPMQSELAQQLMKKHQITNLGIDTLVLIKNGECLLFSSAALQISRDLTGFWYLFNILKVIPSPVRDFFYKVLAQHRYRLFGRTTSCMLPSKALRSRYIGL